MQVANSELTPKKYTIENAPTGTKIGDMLNSITKDTGWHAIYLATHKSQDQPWAYDNVVVVAQEQPQSWVIPVGSARPLVAAQRSTVPKPS